MYIQSVIFETTKQSLEDILSNISEILKINAFDRHNLLEIKKSEEKKSLGVSDVASLQTWSSKKNELIKIAVIYEAEYLTPEAQNSILKILEDTPSKTLIVLCTSDVANLLQTIKSRCKIYKIDYEQSRENSILNKLENSNLLQREKVLYELLTDNTKKNIQKLIENLIREHLQSKKQNKNMIEFLYKMQIANYNGANPKLILDNINFKLSQ